MTGFAVGAAFAALALIAMAAVAYRKARNVILQV